MTGQYKANKLEIDRRIKGGKSIVLAKDILKKSIECQKLNYSFDPEVQQEQIYQGTIRLVNDEKELEIMIQKPDKPKQSSFDRRNMASDDSMEPCDIYQTRSKLELKVYRLKKSKASCKLSDIQSIIYGGLTSRFWMYRKQMIVQNSGKIKSGDAPFYAWECITLQTTDGEVNLVIKV